MVGSGKPVKINATNSAPVKTASKKRRVAATSVVEGESGPSAVEDNKEIPIEPEVVVQPAPDAQPSGGEEAEVKPKLDVTAMLEKLKEDVAAQLAGLKIIAALLRETVKTHGKELRAKGSRKRKNAETEPGVVVEPKPEKTFEIQEPLRDFLGTQPGELVGKRAARKILSTYIKDNKLQDPDDHTLIKPDEKLAKLFGPPRFTTTKENKGYSNLNALRYINDYFIVPTEEVAAPEPEPTPVA